MIVASLAFALYSHGIEDWHLKNFCAAMGIQKTRKESRQKLDALCDDLEDFGITAKPHVYIGDTVAEIDKAARECQSSMIIAGSPRKRLWKDRWGTSISKGLAERSIFPILLIPPKEG